MRLVKLAALLCMLACAAPVLAAEGNSQEGEKLPKFQKADKDGNGSLNLEEAKQVGVSKKEFQEEDLDNDGKLTKYDYKYGVKL